MGTDLSIRPAGPLAVMGIAAPVSPAAPDAVATELPPSQAVTAVQATAPVQIAADSALPMLSHEVILDPEAASIIYRVINDRNDSVVSQFPDDATLRRRAYFRALDALNAQRESSSGTERVA